MTINARDEKWSDWIEWRGGECPLPEGSVCDVKYRSGEVNRGTKANIFSDIASMPSFGAIDWGHTDSSYDIIAYRYKIKEPEGDMCPDLEWLARNVSEWPAKPMQGSHIIGWDGHSRDGQEPDFIRREYSTSDDYTKAQWLQARKDLGLIMSDAEEEIPATEWAGSVPDGVIAHDNVNNPKHYQLRDGYEVYDLRQDLAAKAAKGGATYAQYSDWDRAIEYIIRMWGKNRLEDAKKGRWYLDKLIEKLEPTK